MAPNGLIPTGKRAEDKARADQTLSKVKSINEFLADITDVVRRADVPQSWSDSLADLMPWASALAEAASDAVAPIRFLVKFFEAKTKIHDPHELGYLACRLAYQQSVEQALVAVASGLEIRKPDIHSRLREETVVAHYDFSGFSLDKALGHDFVRDAERFVRLFAEDLSFDEAETNRLIGEIHLRFPSNVITLLSHGKTRDRFAPFRELIQLDAGPSHAKSALCQHAEYQRWLYEESPALGGESFALAHIYVDTECGKLTWGEIERGRHQRSEDSVDPFDEKHGGRHSLLDTVLSLLAAPDFEDAIVVQGPAGAGKSSFTLRLCWELVRHGLRPIRIALKHLDTRDEVSIAESLPAAVRIDGPEHNPSAESFTFKRELFGDLDALFRERIQFRGHTICPYVLILDGWDELSIGASTAYQHQVDRVLGEVRQRFLVARSNVPIRVILTGRPTDAVVKSKFLRQGTMILTIRPFRPEQLRQYLSRLVHAATTAPLGRRGDTDPWQGIAEVKIEELLTRYAKDWKQGHLWTRTAASLDVLGSPLLAFLAVRLLAHRPERAESFIEDTTALYRSLLDLVIDNAGKPDAADDDLVGRAVLRGNELRDLLRSTAEAMTLRGTESITHDQLTAHLQLDEDEIERRVSTLTNEHVLSRLMISFFFHGGHIERGCEFSHKSFREYLFAEQIVECLKRHGRAVNGVRPEKPEQDYHRDFAEDDPRHDLCRDLAHLLGPQWTSIEVAVHVDRLIDWEISRAIGSESYPVVGTPTEPLSLDAWKRVRDHLADIWDWWAEGVHLRPQLRPKGRGRPRAYEISPPLAMEIIEGRC